MRSPEEFQTKAIEKGIERWEIHRCGMCHYPCAYLFNWADTEVAYDAGCNCRPLPPEVRSWADVAAHYNLQTHPDTIARYDVFWGFSAEDAGT